MRLLTIPGAERFTRVTYLDTRTLLVAHYQGATGMYLCDLEPDATPQQVHWPQITAALYAFKRHGPAFLRRQGFWPADLLLLPAFGGMGHVPPVLEPVRYCDPFFHPDGETAAFAETVPGMSYQTRFHLRAGGVISDLLLTSGAFGCSGDFADTGLLAMCNGLKVVWVWDVAGRKEISQLTQGDVVKALAFLPGGLLAVAGGRTVRIWDAAGGREVKKFPAFRAFVEAIAVSPDGSLLAAGSRDSSVRVWEAGSWRERGRHDWGVGAVNAVAFAPDGQTAAAAGEEGVAVWDLD